MPDTSSRPATPTLQRPDREKVNFPIVGVGASAGGLEACRAFVSALPSPCHMAFILVQHFDPHHESMMVDLLVDHTALTIQEAVHGTAIQPETIYVIPSGTYLSVVNKRLVITSPLKDGGPRLPVDHLLTSLAADDGTHSVGIILSGTGHDGSLGVIALKQAGGLCLVQDPAEAGYDGMPNSAIATSCVDQVLPVASMIDAIKAFTRLPVSAFQPVQEASLKAIIALLRDESQHDFTLYKTGTLQRRIQRRMGMLHMGPANVELYLTRLKNDKAELAQLAKDLLIHVTNFFRDPKVFDCLGAKTIPDLISAAQPDQPLRIWVAGCSTGEETYSIAMMLDEAISALASPVTVQIFASDVDPEAVASAREGLYAASIETDVSPERLARYFVREGGGYRVLPRLRGMVVFTVQDVLADPPFFRLDLISCRNLLIYLSPEAQMKVIALFHFALRRGGYLMLGSAETVGRLDGRFEVIAKAERIYRHIGQSILADVPSSVKIASGAVATRPQGTSVAPRQVVFAAICRQILLDVYAPAAVLVNEQFECLYLIGPTERYLTMATGLATLDLLAMVSPRLRTKIRSGIQRAEQEGKPISQLAEPLMENEKTQRFNIIIHPIKRDHETLFLVCFQDVKGHVESSGHTAPVADPSRLMEVEAELEATRAELEGAISNLEISSEEQKAIYEEALSVNQEYQSTNEELLASKEELQSLNEEQSALNTQLHETLERQRSTSDDLQNVLYSTDVATIFLDSQLKIRFFTPATRSLFRVIASDVGRPLSDLNALTTDHSLTHDALHVLKEHVPMEREIEAQSGMWFVRRILPYRTHSDQVEGVVITYTDVTERKQTATALEAARQRADIASVAKSRFLAAASHDLRQPLQTFALIHGLLANAASDPKVKQLVTRLDQTLAAMTGMLNTLLDINQIEAGTVRTEMTQFLISDLLVRVREEFSYHAQSKGIELKLVPSHVLVESDQRLLEQMLRNLISNALKYTSSGKVLIGCRRRSGKISVEVWDTGIGIPEDEFFAIFDEYHQLNNPSRERNRGLGLGLAIVRRLGHLLGYRLKVKSRLSKGSVFSIEGISRPLTSTLSKTGVAKDKAHKQKLSQRLGSILLVEDDPDVRELLHMLLLEEGHSITVAPDAEAALKLIAQNRLRPNLLISDYNLSNGLNGLQLAAKVRQAVHRHIPVIILTGDIKTETLRDVMAQDCLQLNKPVNPKDMMETIQRLLGPQLTAPEPSSSQPPGDVATQALSAKVYVVDDDSFIQENLSELLTANGHRVETYGSCETFLAAYQPHLGNCLLLDAYLPGMTGLELLAKLRQGRDMIPTIIMTGHSDVGVAVRAMKEGASNFIEKPISSLSLLRAVEQALSDVAATEQLTAEADHAAKTLDGLTDRQKEIMRLVLAGHPSKNIAADLDISQRTVENHRAAIMQKTGARSLPELARLAVMALRSV